MLTKLFTKINNAIMINRQATPTKSKRQRAGKKLEVNTAALEAAAERAAITAAANKLKAISPVEELPGTPSSSNQPKAEPTMNTSTRPGPQHSSFDSNKAAKQLGGDPTATLPDTSPKFAFDIDVLQEEDENGYRAVVRENGVKASSPQALAAAYSMTGRQIRIINHHKLDGPKQQPVQQPVQRPAPESVAFEPHGAPPPMPTPTLCNASPAIPSNIADVQRMWAPAPVPEVKYATVAGIKIKIVGDKIYQKQWIRASGEESDSIRVITTASNRILNLTGKHIEVEKWILAEDSDSNDVKIPSGPIPRKAPRKAKPKPKAKPAAEIKAEAE